MQPEYFIASQNGRRASKLRFIMMQRPLLSSPPFTNTFSWRERFITIFSRRLLILHNTTFYCYCRAKLLYVCILRKRIFKKKPKEKRRAPPMFISTKEHYA